MKALDKEGLRPPLVHAANSAAALRHPDSRFDLVRPGLAAYGLYEGFAPVLTLKSKIVYLKLASKGATVSYGATWRAKRASRIATLPIGYGDGYPRALSNRASVLVGGKRCPVVDRVTMDQTMIDVTEAPQAPRRRRRRADRRARATRSFPPPSLPVCAAPSRTRRRPFSRAVRAARDGERMIQGAVGGFGKFILESAEGTGQFTFLVRSTFGWMTHHRIEWRQTLIQMARLGVGSLPVTAMTAFFTGMVLALQTGASSKHFFNEPLFVGTVVSFALIMELAPVMTALVVAGPRGRRDRRRAWNHEGDRTDRRALYSWHGSDPLPRHPALHRFHVRGPPLL